jgi:hypothetical protein
VALVALLAGCTHDPGPVFHRLPSRSPSATAVPSGAAGSAPRYDAPGGSTMTVAGELSARVTADMACNAALDDYFVRGLLDLGDGSELAVSVNVERYAGPRRYDKAIQVLIRRLRGTTYYASWYTGVASGTVGAHDSGVDLSTVELPPEPGTQSTQPITLGGHLGCTNQQ